MSEQKPLNYQQFEDVWKEVSDLFSEREIEDLAVRNGFLKRSRKLTPTAFLMSLVFAPDSNDRISLLDLKFDVLRNHGINISREALHKRFTSEAVDFMKSFLFSLISKHVVSGKLYKLLDNRFSGIYIKDSSKFKIPQCFAKHFPSYGSFGLNTSLMNIQYEFELLSGDCQDLSLTKATRNDQKDSLETLSNIKTNGLYLRDLGYTTMSYLEEIKNKQAFYLNRLPKIGVYQKDRTGYVPVNWKKIDKIFSTSSLKNLEIEVYIGNKNKHKTRLIITRVPESVANKRIRKAKQGGKRKKGYSISDEYKIKARYNLFITNIPVNMMTKEEIVQTYRLRWQVELTFKTWKSNLNIDRNKKMKLERFKCQLFAKLIWAVLCSKIYQLTSYLVKQKNRYDGVSLTKFYKYCKALSPEIRFATEDPHIFSSWYNQSIVPTINELLIEKRLKKETHCEILAMFLSH